MNVFALSLSLLSKLTTTVDMAYTGKTRLRPVRLNFFVDIHTYTSQQAKFCVQ